MSNVKSITPNNPADFTPELGNYKTLQPFRYWCQKVLPLVYDDSLSYYELLCKVVDYLNKTMEDVETLHSDVTNLHTAYEELQSYVNNYFSTLDVQEEINNKLDEMTEDGTLDGIIAEILGLFVTPEMYGAVGDGVHNDTESFIQALSNGKNVFLSSGKTYSILNLPINNDYTNIIGNNAIIKPYDATVESTVININAKHVKIENLIMYGSETIGTTEHGCSLIDVRNNYCTLNNIKFYNNKYVACRIFDSEYCDFNDLYSYGTETTIETLGNYARNMTFNNIVAYKRGLNNFENVNGEAVALYALENKYITISNVKFNKNPNAVLIGRQNGSSRNNNISVYNVTGESYESRYLICVNNTEYFYGECYGRCSTGVGLFNAKYGTIKYYGDSGSSPLYIENSSQVFCDICQLFNKRKITETNSENVTIKNNGIDLEYNCPNSVIIDNSTFSSGVVKYVYGYSAINIECEQSRNAIPILYENVTSIRANSSTFQVYTPESEANLYLLQTLEFKRPTFLILKPTNDLTLTGDYPFTRRKLKAGKTYMCLITPPKNYIEFYSDDV